MYCQRCWTYMCEGCKQKLDDEQVRAEAHRSDLRESGRQFPIAAPIKSIINVRPHFNHVWRSPERISPVEYWMTSNSSKYWCELLCTQKTPKYRN